MRFSTDFTSSNDFFGRVGFFFDRMMTMTIITMIITTREMIMIVRVDRAFTTNDSSVSMSPSSFEA